VLHLAGWTYREHRRARARRTSSSGLIRISVGILNLSIGVNANLDHEAGRVIDWPRRTMNMKLAHLPLTIAVSLSTLLVMSRNASAQQEYPIKPIRVIVGVAPGGATDILARVVGTKLGESFRQPVLVDNRPGANHIIGGQVTAKAPPDGYTVQVVPEGCVINA